MENGKGAYTFFGGGYKLCEIIDPKALFFIARFALTRATNFEHLLINQVNKNSTPEGCNYFLTKLLFLLQLILFLVCKSSKDLIVLKPAVVTYIIRDDIMHARTPSK